MSDSDDSTGRMLARDAGPPPLPAALRQRTLAIARSGLRSHGGRDGARRLADYTPPLALVPSVLISAGAVFFVDALVKVVRLFSIL